MIDVVFHNPFRRGNPASLTNPIVKAFIISETFFWSGQNMLAPLFGIFVAEGISEGSIEAAGLAVTFYMVARIFSELISGKILAGSDNKKKIVHSILGTTGVAVCYFLFTFADSLFTVYVLQALIGISFGVVSPAKYALFSEHLDKGKETTEWGLYDATVYSGMALTAMLGGVIAQRFGFEVLFVVTSLIVSFGVVPYVVFLRTIKGYSK